MKEQDALEFEVVDWGCVGYAESVQRQLDLLERVSSQGVSNTLVFVEHPPILTLGASFHEENLLLTPAEYAERGIEVSRTDRGGDVTYHGPGQLVIYPIFRLDETGKDLHKWMRDLEETMLLTLAEFGIGGRRFPPHTGAWVNDLKIAAIGVKVKRWVSMHGIALNCSNDLEVFQTIVPCGIHDYGVTSLSEELGRLVGPKEAKPIVASSFARVFGRLRGSVG